MNNLKLKDYLIIAVYVLCILFFIIDTNFNHAIVNNLGGIGILIESIIKTLMPIVLVAYFIIKSFKSMTTIKIIEHLLFIVYLICIFLFVIDIFTMHSASYDLQMTTE